MPNWADNVLEIKGKAKDVRAMITEITDYENGAYELNIEKVFDGEEYRYHTTYIEMPKEEDNQEITHRIYWESAWDGTYDFAEFLINKYTELDIKYLAYEFGEVWATVIDAYGERSTSELEEMRPLLEEFGEEDVYDWVVDNDDDEED